jgi:hypothetical protein
LFVVLRVQQRFTGWQATLCVLVCASGQRLAPAARPLCSDAGASTCTDGGGAAPATLDCASGSAAALAAGAVADGSGKSRGYVWDDDSAACVPW